VWSLSDCFDNDRWSGRARLWARSCLNIPRVSRLQGGPSGAAGQRRGGRADASITTAAVLRTATKLCSIGHCNKSTRAGKSGGRGGWQGCRRPDSVPGPPWPVPLHPRPALQGQLPGEGPQEGRLPGPCGRAGGGNPNGGGGKAELPRCFETRQNDLQYWGPTHPVVLGKTPGGRHAEFRCSCVFCHIKIIDGGGRFLSWG